jgi:glycosyltransferase involved in cell wall biosynthesis
MLISPLQHSQSEDTALMVAPFCFDLNSVWHSPGRSKKLHQVQQLLHSFSFTIFRINTAPQTCPSDQYPVLQLSRATSPLLRFIQGLLTAILFLKRRPSNFSPSIIWIYNSRFSEALVSILFFFCFPSARVYVQIEDLPGARIQNSGFRGLLDLLSLFILVARADHIFTVSKPVSLKLCQITNVNPSHISLLPPLLSPCYLDVVRQRSIPFSSRNCTILYAGGYGNDKGVRELISAFLNIDLPYAILQLAGSVPDEILNICSSCPRVDVLGYLSDFELYSRYATADILVNPHSVTKHSDFIFPFKLIEYASSGCLVFTTRMPGTELLELPEVCFFDSINELAIKLSSARIIWARYNHRLQRTANNLRNSYSLASQQPSIAKIFQRTYSSVEYF